VDEYVEVHVSHHQFEVFTGGDPGYLGLYTVGDDLLHLTGESSATAMVGPHTGPVDVRVRPGSAAPPPEPGWIVASEATLWCPDAAVTVCGLMADCPEELREIAVAGPGLVRIQVRGRGLWPQEYPEPELPSERYEVHVWPVAMDTGVRTVRPDDGLPGWDPAPDRAAAWAVDRMITRVNPSSERRNLLLRQPPPPEPPRVDVERRRGGSASPGAVLDRPADLFAAAVDGADLLIPAGDLRIRLRPRPVDAAGPADPGGPADPADPAGSADPAALGALRFRWTWEPAPEPAFPEPMTELPDPDPTEVELRVDPATGELVVRHRGVRGPDAVLLGMVWEYFLARAERLADGAAPDVHPWEAAFAASAAAARQQAEDDRRRRDEQEARHWGGRTPSERIRTLPANCWALSQLDRPLLDALDRATAEVQRDVALWAADRAAAVAGLAEVDWIAPALAALHAGTPLPPPFGDHRQAWDRLLGDPAVPRTTVTIPNGTPNCLQQAMAFPAITAAADPDPLAAAVEAVYAATIAHGDDHRACLAALHEAFPALA
jgi:hypothetical protein